MWWLSSIFPDIHCLCVVAFCVFRVMMFRVDSSAFHAEGTIAYSDDLPDYQPTLVEVDASGLLGCSLVWCMSGK